MDLALLSNHSLLICIKGRSNQADDFQAKRLLQECENKYSSGFETNETAGTNTYYKVDSNFKVTTFPEDQHIDTGSKYTMSETEAGKKYLYVRHLPLLLHLSSPEEHNHLAFDSNPVLFYLSLSHECTYFDCSWWKSSPAPHPSLWPCM